MRGGALGNRLEIAAHPQPDGVALQHAVLLAGQVDSQLGHVVALPQVVVPHQTVEVHGGSQPDVARVIDHLGYACQVRFKVARRRVAAFERRAFVEIQDEQQFILIVERQHLERHAPQGSKTHGSKRQHDYAQQEGPGDQSRMQQWRHERIEELVQPRLLHGIQIVRIVFGMAHRTSRAILASQHVVRQPGSDREGHQHRHEHRHGYVEGHRTHVGSHHAGDQEHRQETDDHGQSRGDQRRPDLGDGFQHDATRGFLAQTEMPRNVFDVHDGIVHQQPQRQDQGEERHAVDREAQQQIDRQSQAENDRHRDRNDQRFAQPSPKVSRATTITTATARPSTNSLTFSSAVSP